MISAACCTATIPSISVSSGWQWMMVQPTGPPLLLVSHALLLLLSTCLFQ
jgi:hypothetical protein